MITLVNASLHRTWIPIDSHNANGRYTRFKYNRPQRANPISRAIAVDCNIELRDAALLRARSRGLSIDEV